MVGPYAGRAGQEAGDCDRAGCSIVCTSRRNSSARACGGRSRISPRAWSGCRRHSPRSARARTRLAGSVMIWTRSARRANRCRGLRRALSRIELVLCDSGRRPIHALKRSSAGSTGRARRSNRWRARGLRRMNDRAGRRRSSLARSLTNLKDALELLNVSMEQGNALYRSIVKKLFDERPETGPHRSDSIRVA